MNNQSLFIELEKLLRMDSTYCTEDGVLLKNVVVEAALALRPDLIRKLLKHDGLKRNFFKDVDGILVFDKVKFQKFHELGGNIVRAAINRLDAFKFSNLKKIYPNLLSIKEFIESDSYLDGINIQIYARKDILDNLTPKVKLFSAIEVLKQIEPLLLKGGVGYKGTTQFYPKQIKDVFREKILKFSLDESSDKELGKSMNETEDLSLRMNLADVSWHAYEDCFGTSEEKHLIKYIESIYPKLVEKYSDIYLLRNEKDLKIYTFQSGEAYQPDYVLFLKKKNNSGKIDYIQIFIEPKGEHLRSADKWKEDAMKQIKLNADIHFSTQGMNFNVWGMPFFTESKRKTFDEAMKESLEF